MKVLVVFLVVFSTFVEDYGQSNSTLSSDLMRVNQIYEEIDSLKSISASNKLYIDSLDGVYFQKLQVKCPNYIGQKMIVDKVELRKWAVQNQSQFAEFTAIIEEFIVEIEIK